MGGLSFLIKELHNLIDELKIPLGGVDLPSGIKDNSGKEISTRKGNVNTMDNTTGNSGGQDSSTGNNNNNNNNSGGVDNGGQGSSAGGSINYQGTGSSAGGIGSSSSSSSNYQGTGSVSDIRERPVNAMSLTQMCNHVVEDKVNIIGDTVNIIEPLDKESLTKVQQVLAADTGCLLKKSS